MAKNWMEKVESKVQRDREKSSREYDEAVKIFKPIMVKYNADGAIDIPFNKLTDKEKKQVCKAWNILGYQKQALIHIVGGLKEFYRLKLNEIY